MIYQPFWVLSANGQQLKSPAVTAAALAHHVDPEQVLFSYLRQQGAQPLSGTTSTVYMKDNLASSDFAPSRAEMRELDGIFLRPRGAYAAPTPYPTVARTEVDQRRPSIIPTHAHSHAKFSSPPTKTCAARARAAPDPPAARRRVAPPRSTA